MKKFNLLLISIFLINLIGNSQVNPPEKCGFNAYHQEKLATDPIYLQKTNEFNQMVRNFVPSKSNATYKIPVVVHVISDGTTLTAITDQQIKDAIKGLNERLRKLAGGLGDGSGVDLEIEYALAVRDPNGNCTDGIVRYDYSGNGTYTTSGIRRSGGVGTTDATLKALSVWSQSTYYNIWLVSEIDNNNGRTGTQGYASFASSHGSSSDGTVILVNSFKNPAGTTLIHELGHSLNLYHTFEGDGAGCPVNTTCSSDGDQVCDTPPHEQSSSDCVVGTNGCDGGSSTELFIHNYMDYSSDICQNMLTAGQKTRMHAAISGTRSSFLEANGNMALVPIDAPSANFYASRYYVCATGQNVNFYDQSTCSPNTYMAETSWTGITYSWNITNNAGTTYTSTVQNPVITINAIGTYDVTLTITTAQGSSTFTKAGMIIVGNTTADAFCTPLASSEGNYLQTVSNVTFNTINSSSSMLNNTTYTNSACTKSTIVSPNTAYSMSVTINAGGSGAEALEVYIDYNSNGDFGDAGEQVMTGSTAINTSSIVTANVTIPAGVTVNTPLRMRVIADLGTISPNERACISALSAGDIEDFTVYASNNIATVSIATTPSTTLTYGTNTTFTATPVNGGTPTYRWFKNNVVIAGETASTYSSTTLLDDDEIYCEMTSDMAGVIASPCTSNVVILTVTGPPISGFSANVTGGCTSTTFNFTDESALAPTSWSWTFAGGTPATSTAQNPFVTFAGTGLHTVTLVATNGLGTGTTETKTDYITVYSTAASPGTPTSGLVGNYGHTVSNVKFNTINSSSSTLTNIAYTDNVCSSNTTVIAGNTYSLSVTLNAGPNATGEVLEVYIDYDNDGVIDAGEQVLTGSLAINTSNTFTTNVIIPLTATLNTMLRMRVIGERSAIIATELLCTNAYEIGDVEDYGVVIYALPTITASSGASRCGTGTVGLSATPSAGIVNWYANSTGGSILGTGTTFTTPSISATTTYYAEAVDGSLISAARTAVVATINNCSSTLAGGSCNVTLTNLSDALYSTAVAGATNYRYLIEHAATSFSAVSTRNAADNLFRMSWLTGVKYGTTYTVKVSAFVGGAWQAYGSACTVTTPATKLQTSSCGSTLTNLSDALYSYEVAGATDYRYLVVNAGAGFTRVSTRGAASNLFRMSWVTGIQIATVYTVSVSAYVGGSWQAYGPSCTVTAPVPTTKLATSSCNIPIPTMSTALYSDPVSGATNFRYKVVNTTAGFNKVSTRNAADNLFRMSWVTGIQTNTTYDIQVSAYLNGMWGNYGTICTVTTPAALGKHYDSDSKDSELFSDFSLETYPNPNTGTFTISASHEGKFNLVNELGQLIRTIEITQEGDFETKIEGLHQGVYFVNGIVNDIVLTRKIIVQ